MGWVFAIKVVSELLQWVFIIGLLTWVLVHPRE